MKSALFRPGQDEIKRPIMDAKEGHGQWCRETPSTSRRKSVGNCLLGATNVVFMLGQVGIAREFC